MAIDAIHAQTPSPSDMSDDDPYYGLYGDWNEKIVTAVAAALAVLIVATVAVLMGMA
jgi:hypothetical protein